MASVCNALRHFQLDSFHSSTLEIVTDFDGGCENPEYLVLVSYS